MLISCLKRRIFLTYVTSLLVASDIIPRPVCNYNEVPARAQETHSTLEKLAGVLSPAPECVFVVVSSHGHERAGAGSSDTDIRCHDGRLVSLLDIISYFSNRRLPLLRDVPKVFIFQTCRYFTSLQLWIL